MENSNKAPKWASTLIYVLMGVIIGIVISYAMVASGIKKEADNHKDSAVEQSSTTTENAEASTEESTEVSTESTEASTEVTDASTEASTEEEERFITTYEYKHTEVTGDELEAFKKDLHDRVDGVIANNSFVQLQTGEDRYETYVYNSKGECLANESDGSYSAVFRNDGKTIKYENSSGAIAVGTDIDIMKFILNAVDSVGAIDSSKLYSYELDEDIDYNEYRVDLQDEYAIRLCYSPLGESFADVMLESIKSQDENWKPHLVVVICIPKDAENRNFGAFTLSVYDDLNEEFTNWDLLGWLMLDDWELDNWWYTYDFSQTNTEEFVSHMKELSSDIQDKVDSVNEKINSTGVSETNEEEDASDTDSSSN